MVRSGRSVNVTTLFLCMLRPPKQLTSTKVHLLSPVTLFNQRKEKNESKWPDMVSNLGPLALKSDTELDGLY